MALARAFDGTILLLRAYQRPTPAYPYGEVALTPRSSEDLQQEAASYLDEVAGRLRRDGAAVQTNVREGWAPNIIAYQGPALGSSLIIMATHGRTGIARLLLGSVALEVVRRSPLPVMLIRPPERTEEAIV